ncbi:MAG: rhodanese-like domain-containing protein [Magnetospirillum sp. WYHS-4]
MFDARPFIQIQEGFAGNVAPFAAWQMLAADPRLVMVDVRTEAEWNFVGHPDLSSLGKELKFVQWQLFPGMAANPDFAVQLEKAVPDKDTPILFICRIGQRSRHAAVAATAQGYRCCYNVADGFEGKPDEAKHRGLLGGWKVEGLPWVQY